MNGMLIAAGVTAAAVSAIHLTAGHVDTVRPLLASALAQVPKRTMHAVWHLVSADLVLAAAALIFLGLAQPEGTQLVGLLIGVYFAAYSGVFLVITLTFDGWTRLFRLPQWLLLLPISVLALLGSV
ncbi:hypothetical protein BFN03_00630 [Rhodococcus sp. WMMA185]|uniref:hypothetical protein n=1 Tax=Rhodococcus sp. WMMA185 TaxID=679318 RepID=UPI000878D0A6|nr:hypothetical protein [Rhodococcus sp. WMMA185]AOW91689.1 hypothetical protein BFN03_00630 [Rhodococcus sp. WMMA185]